MQDSQRKIAGLGRLLRRSFAFACLASFLFCSRGEAAVNILVYGQNVPAGTNTLTLHNDGAGHETLTSTDVPVSITTLNGAGVPAPGIDAILNLSAHNVGAAIGPDAGGNVSESFTGTFSIIGTSSPFLGVNLLSGTFTDAFSGKVGQSGSASLRVSNPTDMLTFTSALAPFLPTGPPSGMSLSFTNLSQNLVVVNGSIGAVGNTTMSQSGVFSASTHAIPEPSSLLIAGIGGLGLIGYGLRRRKTLGT
jgi:hypothetical protein